MTQNANDLSSRKDHGVDGAHNDAWGTRAARHSGCNAPWAMKVERERFLVLVAALAAGCRGVGASAEPPESAMPPDVAFASAPDDSAPTLSRPAATHDVRHPAPMSTRLDKDALPTREGGTRRAKRCDPWDNMQGFAQSCVMLRAPAPTCESIDGEGLAQKKEECDHFAVRLKPKAAERATACLLAKSGTSDLCELDVSATCATAALEDICVEPAAVPICAGVTKACTGQSGSTITRASCEAGYSAMQDTERATFVTCVTESCDVGVCMAF